MTKKNSLVVLHEFGTLVRKGQKVFLKDNEDEQELSDTAFENLWNFILENKTSDDLEQVMSVHQRKGRQYIKCGRYVGTVQTKDGTTIEILPKIYGCSGKTDEDIKKARKVFLNMLRHFKNSEAKSFQSASLATSEKFPLLEFYISKYITEVESILHEGIKKNYSKIHENACFIKGRLNVQKQICRNFADKVHFRIEYSKYIEDIPQNRLIVSTLYKLIKISYSASNKARIYRLLSIFSEIPESKNINADLQISLVANRLFERYENIMLWSSQFLLNKGFTTFYGSYVNQALLFSAEKLFESYIAALFKSYMRRHPKYNVFTQHRQYYLVDKHNKNGKFQIRPDIFLESADKSNLTAYENIIIDTKWKIIDENKPDKNYFMSISDMYQLYAYGKKYSLGEGYFYDVNPRLVLIYPSTEFFKKELPSFFYEDIRKEFGLKLSVIPFNLSVLSQKDIDRQIDKILDIAAVNELSDGSSYVRDVECVAESNYNANQNNNPRYMLIGYVKSEAHIKWIKNNKLYNVRMGESKGALSAEEVLISPSRLFLYDKNGRSWICTVNQAEFFYFNKDKMKELEYPEPSVMQYKLFRIQEIVEHERISIERLNQKYNYKDGIKEGRPFFISY